MIDLPVTIDDVRRAEAAIAGEIVRDAADPGRRAVRNRRLRGLSEARDAAGDRLLQGARRAQQADDARRGGAARRGRRDVGRQPRPGRRLSCAPSRHPGDDRHAHRHAVHQDRPHRGAWAPGSCCAATASSMRAVRPMRSPPSAASCRSTPMTIRRSSPGRARSRSKCLPTTRPRHAARADRRRRD